MQVSGIKIFMDRRRSYHRGAEEELAVEWSLGIICTLVYYTASSTGRDDCEYATRQTIGHWKALRAHVLSIFLQNKIFMIFMDRRRSYHRGAEEELAVELHIKSTM